MISSSVLGVVESPMNRSLSTAVAYKNDRQHESQIVQAFAEVMDLANSWNRIPRVQACGAEVTLIYQPCLGGTMSITNQGKL